MYFSLGNVLFENRVTDQEPLTLDQKPATSKLPVVAVSRDKAT
jgi:hypothetical protein